MANRILSINPLTLLVVIALAAGIGILPERTEAASTLLVPADYATIQAAIDASVDGDEIVVSAGTYVENIYFQGKAITLRSASGSDSTIIDGSHSGSVVRMSGAGATLTGFTIRNGFASGITDDGGGIRIFGDSTVRENVITSNSACTGTGIYVEGSPIIEGNEITGNHVEGCGGFSGGSIVIRGDSDAVIKDNYIASNAGEVGAGILIRSFGGPNVLSPLVQGNRIEANSGGSGVGLYVSGRSNARIVQNVITDNTARNDVVFTSTHVEGDGPTIVGNTIADNIGTAMALNGYNEYVLAANNVVAAAQGQIAIDCYNAGGVGPVFRNNDVVADAGMTYIGCTDATGTGGNISTDPEFIGGTDYRLKASSSAVDAGDNSAPGIPLTDFDGDSRIVDGNGDFTSTIDIGAYEFQVGSSPPQTGQTIEVPFDYPTIQAAIDAAENGDRINVRAGTYNESIDFLGKLIVVAAVSGPHHTVIDAGGTDRVVTMASHETQSTVLQGFTLRNGYVDTSPYKGGGIFIDNASPTILNNIIEDNHACDGSGIYSNGQWPLIIENTFSNNSQVPGCGGVQGGGGITIGQGLVSRNKFYANRLLAEDGWGGGLFVRGAAIVQDNIIEGNSIGDGSGCGRGGGIASLTHASMQVIQNLIINNRSGCGGSMYWGAVPDGLLVASNTIADNTGTRGSIYIGGRDNLAGATLVNNIISSHTASATVFCQETAQTSLVMFNDVYNSLGAEYGGTCPDRTGQDGNISGDPLFRSDYELTCESPAIDSGDTSRPELPPHDLDGGPRVLDGDSNGSFVVDLGAYEAGVTCDLPAPVGGEVSLTMSATRGGPGYGELGMAAAILMAFTVCWAILRRLVP